MTYHTFIQYNNGLLQDFIDKFKPRTTISSISKCQNKYIFRQTSPKRPSQAKENPNEKNSQYNQLSTRTNKHSLWCSHPYIHIRCLIFCYTYYTLHGLTVLHEKPTLKILFISNAQFGMKHRSSKKRKNRFFIFKTLLSRFLPMLNLVIRPSFLSHTAYTLMVVFYIFALSLKNKPQSVGPIIQDTHIGRAPTESKILKNKCIISMKKKLSLFILAGGLLLGAGIPATAQKASVAQPIDLTYAAENSVNSVVYIKVTTNSKTQTIQYVDPFEDFFSDFFGNGGGRQQQRQIQTPKRQGAGSGVILSADGYIVTNNHVVKDADELLVKLNDNREFKGRIIGTDPQTDLALIKIEADKLQPITVGNSENLKVGEWVLAIGNPFSLTSTVTAGIVSAKARGLGATGGIESFIQTDAAINPGNSGGALVNARGELVGINAMLYSQTGSFSGYGFAIPTSIMNKVVDDLKKFGTVQRAVLGIKGNDVSAYIDQKKERDGKDVDLGTLTGVYVAETTAGSAVEDVLKEGDVITAINGHKVENMGQLQEQISKLSPGDKVEVTYMREKKERKATVTLRNVQGTTSKVEAVDSDMMGAALRPLTDAEKKELNLRYGLVVSAIRSGKMKDAGITKGTIIMQVNDREMRTTEDFDEAVKSANLSTDRVLWIRAKSQSGLNRSYTIELTQPKDSKKK